jgi:hypothetical protein
MAAFRQKKLRIRKQQKSIWGSDQEIMNAILRLNKAGQSVSN